MCLVRFFKLSLWVGVGSVNRKADHRCCNASKDPFWKSELSSKCEGFLACTQKRLKLAHLQLEEKSAATKSGLEKPKA